MPRPVLALAARASLSQATLLGARVDELCPALLPLLQVPQVASNDYLVSNRFRPMWPFVTLLAARQSL